MEKRKNKIMQDGIYGAMLTVLGIYRNALDFTGIVRSYWTTVCSLNGIFPDNEEYDVAYKILKEAYAKEGIELDDNFMSEQLWNMTDCDEFD